MSVQPTHRTPEQFLRDWGMWPEPVATSGHYVLEKAPRDIYYRIVDSRPGMSLRLTIARNPHDGWLLYLPEGPRRVVDPFDAFWWWVGLQGHE